MLDLLHVVPSACASYSISKDLRPQAKPLRLAQVKANPSAYTGRVIWIGKVINALDGTNGASIYVLNLPLRKDDRPKR